MGAGGVWIGTRFVASTEANAPPIHKEAVLKTKHDETFRTLVFTGRPLRIGPNEYARDWETKRSDKMKRLLSEGTVPSDYDQEMAQKGKFDAQDIECLFKYANKPRPYPHLMGQVAGSIYEIKPAKEIIEEIVMDAVNILYHISGINVIPPTFKNDIPKAKL
jgi:NAD(P)H-dependent flavin oxidoreductase YrpB (nitropropane dioxygenase family)